MLAIIKELQAFTKRDLQEYSFKDYSALSRGSRFFVLTILVMMLLLISFFFWRYFWGNELLETALKSQQKTEKQLQLLKGEIQGYQQFLKEASVIQLQSDLDSQIRARDREKNGEYFSEVNLIHQVEALLAEYGVMQLELKPHKMEMMFNEPKRRDSASLSSLKSELTTDLIPIRSSLGESSSKYSFQNTQSSRVGNRTSQAVITDSTADKKVSRLSLELLVCGKYSQLFSFFAALEQQSTLFYLEKLLPEKSLESCNEKGLELLGEADRFGELEVFEDMTTYRMILQLYDIPSLQVAYQGLLEASSDSVEDGLPRTISEFQHYVYGLSHGADASESEGFVPSLRGLFQSTPSKELTHSVYDEILHEEIASSKDRYRWNLGETYQGMRLMGIVVQGEHPFALIESRDNGWEKVRVGERHIIRMMPHYLELTFPMAEQNKTGSH